MDFKEYLKHISIVIFGILIAFWINNLGMYYKEKSTQKQVLTTILHEIRDNNENIKLVIQNLDTLHETFAGLKKKNTVSHTVTVHAVGINARSIGYETAKYTGIIKDIRYKLSSRIVASYETQNSLKELDKLMSTEMMSMIKNGLSSESNLDYLLLLMSNLKEGLEEFDADQKQLILDLKEYLQET